MRVASRFILLVLLVCTTATQISKAEDDDNGKDSKSAISSTKKSKNNKDIEIEEEYDDESVSSEDDDDDDGNPVELNPGYVGVDNDDDDDDDDDDDGNEDAKTKTNKSLAADSPKRSSTMRKAIKFLKKHRFQITIAMILIAFRREIGGYLLSILRPEVYDPVTNTSTRKWMKLDATNILKLIVFVDIMRQLQQQASGGEGGNNDNSTKRNSPIMLIAMLLLGTRNPILSSIITKALLNENNSYIPPVEQHYTFERLNDRYKKDCLALQKAANLGRNRHNSRKSNKTLNHNLSPLSSLHSQLRDGTADETEKVSFSETVIIIDLSNVNISPGRMDSLRDEVNFLVQQHRQQTIPYASTDDGHGDDTGDDDANNKKTREVELLVLLESPGGAAADFALASQQLLRLRKEPGIKVTVCVDKVAASGGYMIACAASPGHLFAAPFAVLGSIGVVGQAVNVQKTLEGWGVRPMVFKAGKDKAPLGLIGDIKQSDIQSIQTMVDETHAAFKRHVVTARPNLANDIEELATGRVWMGYDALEVGLIDRLMTSDEYIVERMQDGARLLKLMKNTRKRGLLGGGGHNSRGGIEGRIQSSIVNPLKTQAIKVLNGLVGQFNLPEEVEELEEVVPLSSRVGYKNIDASVQTSFPSLSTTS